MAKKPYWLVAYGHVMRVSDRCDTEREAKNYCFGSQATMTLQRMTGKSWGYVSGVKKRAIIIGLALLHFEKTGSVLSGCEKEIAKHQQEKARVQSRVSDAESDPGPANPYYGYGSDEPAGGVPCG